MMGRLRTTLTMETMTSENRACAWPLLPVCPRRPSHALALLNGCRVAVGFVDGDVLVADATQLVSDVSTVRCAALGMALTVDVRVHRAHVSTSVLVCAGW